LAAIKAGRFDLALMDVQMPGMDGLACAAEIRRLEQAEQRPRLPIIAMTACALPNDRERCLSAGMDAYLSKPIVIRELLEVIETLLPPLTAAEKQTPAVDATAAPEFQPARIQPLVSVAAEATPISSARPAAEPVCNLALAREQLDWDDELLHELSASYRSRYQTQLAELRKAVESGDAGRITFVAHALKGSLGIFAAQSAREAAAQLERTGKNGVLTEAAEQFHRLESLMQQVAAELAQAIPETPADTESPSAAESSQNSA
jgi:CheY-like chemotaxis protein